MKSTVAAGAWSDQTANSPSGLKERMALFARVWWPAKLIVLVGGRGEPAGKSRRSPPALALTTVKLAATVRAVAGTPQRPAAVIRRAALARSAGPSAPRVSRSRQGGME